MDAAHLRGKLLHVQHLADAWIRNGGDPAIPTDIMQKFLAEAKEGKWTEAERILNDLLASLETPTPQTSSHPINLQQSRVNTGPSRSSGHRSRGSVEKRKSRGGLSS